MIEIELLKDEPIILAALALKIARTPLNEGTIAELYEDCARNRKASKDFANRIINSNKHLIPTDFCSHAIILENLSRFAAIYIWRAVSSPNLIFGAGVEASFRMIKPSRYIKRVGGFIEEALNLYQQTLDSGALKQDAKLILPEGILTRMIFSAPPRYLVKLADYLQETSLLELCKIGRKIKELVKEEMGFNIPREPVPSRWKFWGKEDLKERMEFDYQQSVHSISLNMTVKGSLSMFADLVRQRQQLCNIESLEGIVRRGTFVVPPSFSKEIRESYENIAYKAREEQMRMIRKRNRGFVYSLLLGQQALANIYAKGAGVIESSKARVDGVVYPELRSNFGIPLTRRLAKYSDLEKLVGPLCWREKKCIEPSTLKTKENICPVYPVFIRAKGKWEKPLSELLNLLSEDYGTFEV